MRLTVAEVEAFLWFVDRVRRGSRRKVHGEVGWPALGLGPAAELLGQKVRRLFWLKRRLNVPVPERSERLAVRSDRARLPIVRDLLVC